MFYSFAFRYLRHHTHEVTCTTVPENLINVNTQHNSVYNTFVHLIINECRIDNSRIEPKLAKVPVSRSFLRSSACIEDILLHHVSMNFRFFSPSPRGGMDFKQDTTHCLEAEGSMTLSISK